MNVKNTYPSVKNNYNNRRKAVLILRWPFILLAIASVVVNLCVGGPCWCIVADFSLYVVWKLFVSPDLIEYNRISQSVKALWYVCILLALIDIFLANGFALFVIPIVSFGGLAVCIVLFFSNVKRQVHNMLPLVNFIFVSIVGSGIALYFNHSSGDWPFIVLLGLSIIFLFALIIVLKEDFKREFQKRFHIK
jgi:hypothetical protein